MANTRTLRLLIVNYNYTFIFKELAKREYKKWT